MYFAHSGIGTAPHLAGVLLNQLSGTDLEPVPFKGGAPALVSVMAGCTRVTFATPPSVLPHFKTGRLVGPAPEAANNAAEGPCRSIRPMRQRGRDADPAGIRPATPR